MLGKSLGARWLVIGLGFLLAVGCAHNVPQGKATGEDGKIKGARPIELEEGEGRTQGIVTYPGGDRIDWRVVELPEKKKGKLEVKLSWVPPRPGLQLAVDVFDQFNHKVAGSKKTSKRRARSSGRVRRVSVPDAQGKYFIRVYAVGRGDAGKYRLTLTFTEREPEIEIDPTKIQVADPPKLADVPANEVPCDPFDVKNPSCKNVCPDFGAPPGWPPCKNVCPNPPDAQNPACWATMACPKGAPDERIKSCKPSDWPPCPNKDNPDMSNPNCRVKPKPLLGRIFGANLEGGKVVVRIGVGKNQGVKMGWSAQVVRSADLNASPLSGGKVDIFRVDSDVTWGKVGLTPDQLKNAWVRLDPP